MHYPVRLCRFAFVVLIFLAFGSRVTASLTSSEVPYRLHLFPTVDVSYLVMITDAIKQTGSVIDRSQMGTNFAYHDLSYRSAAALSS